MRTDSGVYHFWTRDENYIIEFQLSAFEPCSPTVVYPCTPYNLAMIRHNRNVNKTIPFYYGVSTYLMDKYRSIYRNKNVKKRISKCVNGMMALVPDA